MPTATSWLASHRGSRLLFLGKASVAFAIVSGALLLLFSRHFLNKSKPPSFFFETATPEILARDSRRFDELNDVISQLNHILISNYVRWHRATLLRAKAGKVKNPKLRTLIFLGNEGKHGLGDRLRGILHAYLCAVFSERLLLIRWEEPFPLSRVFTDGLETNFTYTQDFKSKRLKNGTLDEVTLAESELLDLDVLASPVGTVILRCEPRPHWAQVFEVPDVYPGLKVSRQLQALMPLPMQPKAEQFFPLIFKALFRPSLEFRKMLSEPIDDSNWLSLSRIWKRGPLRRINTRHRYISIHARLGHGVGEHVKRFKHGKTLRYAAECFAENALQMANERGITDPPRFYLATDTIDFRKSLKRAFLRRDKRIKLMFGSWGVKHVRDLRRGVQGDSRKYLYTFMDIYLLSRGDSILYIKSGFANLAKWMGNFKMQRVFRFDKCPETGIN